MSRSRKLQSINESISQHKTLSALLKHAQKIEALDGQLQKSLPDPVKGLCQLAHIRGETAVFTCESQIAASKVRMFSRDILQTMQKEYKISVKKLKLLVTPPSASSWFIINSFIFSGLCIYRESS